MKMQLRAPDYGVTRQAPAWPALASVAEPRKLPGLQFNTVQIDFKEIGLKYTTSSFEVNLASEQLSGLVSGLPGVLEFGGVSPIAEVTIKGAATRAAQSVCSTTVIGWSRGQCCR